MTQVGHIMTGAALGVLCLPRTASRLRKVTHLSAFMLLSNVPDLPLKNWGHDRYYFSHSVFINLLASAALILVLAGLPRLRAGIGGWTVTGLGSLAWLSHLLLDSFYNHGKGVAIFWPFSRARLVLPIPWLSVVPHLPPPVTPDLLRIFLVEFVTCLPLVVLAILIHRRYAWN
jgi:hypothetical protein